MTDRTNAPGCGRLFVLSGPSGVGMVSLLARLFADLPRVARSVSATTRAPRPGETDGVDYHFVTRAQFEADIARDYFFEYARYGDNLYGTPRDKVDAQRAGGLDVFLEIEVQGAQIVRRLCPDAILVYVQPPSLEELERRLRQRGTETEAAIAQRLGIAQAELECLEQYDYNIVNDDLDAATDALRAIVVAERHRIRRAT